MDRETGQRHGRLLVGLAAALVALAASLSRVLGPLEDASVGAARAAARQGRRHRPTAPSLQDRHPTATSGDDTMAGPEVQANAGASRDRLPRHRAARPRRAAAEPRRATGLTITGALALAAITALAAQVAFEHGVVVAVVGPLVALGLGTLGTVLVGYALISVRDLHRRKTVLVRAGGSYLAR